MILNDESDNAGPEDQGNGTIFDEHIWPNHGATTNRGSGAIAQGDYSVAAGERGIGVGGNVKRSLIFTGDYKPVSNTVINYHLTDPDKEDIDRLKSYSASTRTLLQDTAWFSIGSTTVKVRRSAVETLHTMATSGSVILTGAPGIGKTGVLLDWLHHLDDTQTDYVFLSAANIEAHDSAQVRIPPTLSQDLVDLLLKWPGTDPAYLVIDALDGAKDNWTADTLVNLIKRLLQRQSRWRVVVSIREFDLGHHNELRALFKGQPAPSAQHPDYDGIRHIYIKEFTEAELRQVASQVPQLTALILQQDSPLAELLKVPFNLRLAAELLDAGVALNDLSPIQSQIELLDRFWATRVLQPNDKADARELLLRRCIEAMIQQRTLRCNRSDIIQHPEDSANLDSLLSCHILANWRPSDTDEPERYVLTFSHHILFDFAVARLLFRASGQPWLERTIDDPELIFVAYPSYVYHFHHLWHRHTSRTDFWQAVYSGFNTEKLSEISRTIGPTVAAALAKATTDLEPLLASLTGLPLQPRAAAERILPHLIGSLEAEPTLVATQSVLWSTVAERLSAMLRPTTVYPLNTLLQLFIQQRTHWAQFQWQPISTAARALLQFAWDNQLPNPRLIEQAITVVCVTYRVDPTNARALLSRLLEPAYLMEHGHNDLAPIAKYILWIATADPDFTRKLYTVVFAFTDERNEPVTFGGQITSITTTKRNRYRSVQRILADGYKQILTEAPALGTQILLAVLNSYGYLPWTDPTDEAIGLFTYRGQETKIRFPPEPIFYPEKDEVQFERDDKITMLKTFDSFLSQQADDEQGMQNRQRMLDELAGQVLPMILVRRLLNSAARHPATLGMEVRELAWALPLLTHGRTLEAIGTFISAIFPGLEPHERQRIEETILSIPRLLPDQDQERSQYIQEDLLLRLIPAKLVSEDAKASLIAALQNQAKVEPPEFNGGNVFEGMFSPYNNQLRQAIPFDDPHYQAVQLIRQTVQTMAENLSNTSPSDEQVQTLLHTINELQTILRGQSETAERSMIAANAWDALSEAAWLIAYWPSLLDHPMTVYRVRDLLLAAAKRPEPIGDSRTVDNMLQGVYCSPPAARIYAARGLLKLATLPDCTDDNVLDTLRALADDPAPSVRIQIAKRIHFFMTLFTEFMWEILEQRIVTESHPQILHVLLQYPLTNLQHKHGERIIPLVQAIDSRIRNFERVEIAINQVVEIYLHQYLFYQSTTCRDLLLQIADHPYEHVASAWPLAFHLCQSIERARQANRAYQLQVDLFNRLISSTCQACKKYIAELEQRSQVTWTETEQQILHDLLKLANHLSQELLFLSGAFHANSIVPRNANDDPPPLPEHVQQFWLNHHQSIRLLTDLGLPNLTHHMLEILDFMAPLAPAEVFLLFRDALHAAASSGYQHEKMGVDLAMKIVNSFLSEYRAIFQQAPACGPALLDILNILLQSGWPDTRKLAHQISKLYR